MIKTSPQLSVIIPTHNRAGLVADCVRSILDSGVPDLEVIVADDGSTDETREVVGALGPRVIHLWQANAGPAAARNAGFERSRGALVTFLDSDDQWLAGGMSRLVDVLARHPDVPLAFADTRQGNPTDGYRSFVETFGGAEFSRLPARIVEPGLRRLEASPFLRRLARRNVLFLGSLVMRRQVFERSGGFDPALRGAADWEFFMRLAAEHEFVYCEHTQASLYLTHPGCMSHDGDGMQQDFIKALAAVLHKARLSPAERALIRHELSRHRFEWAYSAYDRGDIGVATDRFAEAWKCSRFDQRAFMYWLACRLLPGDLQRLRSLKRAIVG
jgi:glycosyltransferase involved in cell wall biosynthesis